MLYMPLDLDGKLGHAVFRAVHRDAPATLYWHLDDTYLGETQLFHEKAVRAAPGAHTLVLVDQSGQRLEQRFSVVNPVR
jgi:penicillin-binding protein 1C